MSPAMTKLRASTAACKTAHVRLSAEQQAYSDQAAKTVREAEEHVRLCRQQEDYKVAILLGDNAGPEIDHSQIEGLATGNVVNERVKAKLGERLDAARAAAAAAEIARDDAAYEFLLEADMPQRRERVIALLEELGPALGELMGAHAACTRFARHRNTANSGYGPAWHLMECLIDHRWQEWPYSLRPTWVPKNGAMPRVTARAGFAEGEKAANALVEEVSK